MPPHPDPIDTIGQRGLAGPRAMVRGAVVIALIVASR